MLNALDAEASVIPFAAQRDERRVPGAGQGQRAVDLVRQYEDAVPVGECRDPLQVRHAEYPPGRIVRVAEQVTTGARGERRLERLEVKLPAAGHPPDHGHFHHPLARVGDMREERRVHRRVDDHAVTGLEGEPEDDLDPGHDVGYQVNQVRVDRPAVPGRGEPGERLADARQVGVAAVAAVDGRRNAACTGSARS
jgi:hypothetical protein